MDENTITISKEIYNRMQESERLLKIITQNISMGMFTYHLEENNRLVLKDVNPAVEKILHFDCRQLIGKTIEEAFPPLADTEIPKRYRDAAKNGTSWHTEQMNYDDNKIAGSYLVHAFNIGPNKMIASFVDVTRLAQAEENLQQLNQSLTNGNKAIEESNINLEKTVQERTKELKETTLQLIQSEKLSALGELSAGVAHELNQPLNGIKIIAQSITRDLTKGNLDESMLKNDLQDIISQVNKMAEIINHMRVFTRNTLDNEFQTVEIESVIRDALKFQEQQLINHGITLKKEFSENLPKLHGNPVRLEQVILNLLSNARDALENKSTRQVTIRTYQNNQNLTIEISDTGSGIPENIKSKIFDPFFTTKEAGKGTGLGLSVAKKIVEEHKGKIEIESKKDFGSTFKIILPIFEKSK